jgi:hypothetical protein
MRDQAIEGHLNFAEKRGEISTYYFARHLVLARPRVCVVVRDWSA